MSVQFKLRNSSKVTWALVNPVLAAGEPGVEVDTGQMKIGNGVSAWNFLPYVSAGDNATVALPNSLITSTEWLAGGNDAGVGKIYSSGDGLHWVESSNNLESEAPTYIYTLVWTGSQCLAGGNTDSGKTIVILTGLMHKYYITNFLKQKELERLCTLVSLNDIIH